ncbi:hypothetical protein E1262_16380 [Jiangella aurantiaca]|uniref:Uncharacterized protein n=1 Tax=Jiangella aurantiaca TaxID=2530373 RepID=A0A4R5AB18_9ACTN|nr:hypothetical protein [Jiangella aurantiaca]TDD68169.1 hypothetical protein E1262_16380 [Jiangella aurantiaca]
MSDAARTVRVAGTAPSLVVRAGWLLLLAVFCLTMGAPLIMLVRSDVRDGVALGEALWDPDHRALTIAATVLGLALVAGIVVTVVRLPRNTTRREIVVDAGGLLVTEHPKWWHRGGWARIGWDGIQVVNAPARGTGPGQLLELYLTREVPGLPAFAATDVAVEADTEIEGVRVPAHRLRIGGLADPDAAPAVAEAVAERRPDLFYAGIRVDQWFTPPRLATARADPPPEPLAQDDEAAPPPPVVPRPAGPVWLAHGESWPRVLAAILVQAAVVGGGGYLMNNPFGLPAVPSVLIALVLLVPFLFCCLTLPITLWLVPRFTAGVGILVSADGLVFVRKRRWRPRALVRTAVSWDWVQAALVRDAFHVANTAAKRNRSVDLYLYENPELPTPIPGVGADVTATRHPQPDSVGTARVVHYPAIRLRLTYRRDLEARGRALWTGPLGDGREPVRMPAHQLRPALLAFRPDLCHGFDDVWQGVGSVRVGR